MGRTVLAVILGIVAAGLVVAGIEYVAHLLHAPPVPIDTNDPDAVRAFMQTVPATALVSVVLAWALGSIAGGFVAAKVSRLHKRGAALAVGVLMVLLVAANFFVVPHPAWMMAMGVLLPVPSALVGRKLSAI